MDSCLTRRDFYWQDQLNLFGHDHCGGGSQFPPFTPHIPAEN